MSNNIKKFLNVRVLIIIVCIIIFVLINSIQENYVSLDDVKEETLITTDITPTTTPDTDPPTTTTPGPTIPTETPDIPDNGGITEGGEVTIPAQIIPIVIVAALIALVFLLYFQKKRVKSQTGTTRTPIARGLKSRRERFRTKIKTLVEILNEYLNSQRYKEGVIYGFHQLDENMKKILGIKRETHLTPKEFSDSLDLPEIIPHLETLVEIFYLARYKQSTMSYDELKNFILKLEKIQSSSKSQSEIEIVETKEVNNEL